MAKNSRVTSRVTIVITYIRELRTPRITSLNSLKGALRRSPERSFEGALAGALTELLLLGRPTWRLHSDVIVYYSISMIASFYGRVVYSYNHTTV